MAKKICISLADLNISYQLRYAETSRYFKNYISHDESSQMELKVTDDTWERHGYSESIESKDYLEFYALLGITSRELLKYNKCLFHGVAFLWHDKAWIITAPSGTGKTTQYRLWNQLYGNEIEIINGDKPIIECKADETIWVYPSPWNGKENISGTKCGELAGIIVLEQDKHNEIQRMSIRECMIPIYRQFLYYGDYEDEIKAVGNMEDIILRNIPVWKLCNLGDEASVRLTHSTLQQYLRDE